MGKAEAGSLKAISNKLKARGLGKLRFYCQTCQKQCRDENGYKAHVQSESHLRLMLAIGSSAGRVIGDYSHRMQSDFMRILRTFGEKRVLMNRVYQLYIADKNHIHLNATRFKSMTEFCKHLGRTGVARMDQDDQGWWIAWIDNSQSAVERQQAALKKDRMTVDDESRERKLIQAQIDWAKQMEREGEHSNDSEDTDDAQSILAIEQNGDVEINKPSHSSRSSEAIANGEGSTLSGSSVTKQKMGDPEFQTTQTENTTDAPIEPIGPIQLTFIQPKTSTTFVNPARKNPFKKR